MSGLIEDAGTFGDDPLRGSSGSDRLLAALGFAADKEEDPRRLRMWMRLIEEALEFRAEALRAEAEGRKTFQGPDASRSEALGQLSAFERSFARGRPSEGRLRKRIGELSPAGRSFLDYGLARAAYAAGAAAVPRLEDLNLSDETDRELLRVAVERGRGLLRDDPGPAGQHTEDLQLMRKLAAIYTGATGKRPTIGSSSAATREKPYSSRFERFVRAVFEAADISRTEEGIRGLYRAACQGRRKTRPQQPMSGRPDKTAG